MLVPEQYVQVLVFYLSFFLVFAPLLLLFFNHLPAGA